MKVLLVLVIILAIILLIDNANICNNWGASKTLGSLDSQLVNEASGIETSDIVENRLFHINDSGDSSRFFVSELSGANLKSVKINNFSPIDFEDLSYGKCSKKDLCLYIGDIGDNSRTRKEIKIVLIKDQIKFKSSVEPYKIIYAQYPDGAQNAEAMALHPNGSLYIITKERKNNLSYPAKIYALSEKQISSKTKSLHLMSLVGTIDLPTILSNEIPILQIATSFDISKDGTKFVILTYSKIIEINMDLSKKLVPTKQWKKNKDYTVSNSLKLPQQESICYSSNDSQVIYNTEYLPNFGSVPIIKMSCNTKY